MIDEFDLPYEQPSAELERRVRQRVLTGIQQRPSPVRRLDRRAPLLAGAAVAAVLAGGVVIASSDQSDQPDPVPGPTLSAAPWDGVDTEPLAARLGKSVRRVLVDQLPGATDVSVQTAAPESKMIAGVVELTTADDKPAVVAFQVSRDRFLSTEPSQRRVVVESDGLRLTLYSTSAAGWIASYVGSPPQAVVGAEADPADVGHADLEAIASDSRIVMPDASDLSDLYGPPRADRSYPDNVGPPTDPDRSQSRGTGGELTPSGLGGLELGMPTQGFLALGGALSPASGTHDGGRCDVLELPDASVVEVPERSGATVIDPPETVRSVEGIMYGSTLDDLREAYPDADPNPDEQGIFRSGSYEYTVRDGRVVELRVLSREAGPCRP